MTAIAGASSLMTADTRPVAPDREELHLIIAVRSSTWEGT
jgi:hypothetical protein